MQYAIRTTAHFDHEFKRLFQKYVSLKCDFEKLIYQLKENPETGTPLGGNIYKIRLAIASKGKGKSGGARVITYIKTEQGIIYLISIYDKSEKSTISDNEIHKILSGEIK